MAHSDPAQEQPKNSAKKVTGRPFKKGVSGNPGGRPKGSVNITTLLRAALEAKDQAAAKLLALAIIDQAMSGNSTSLKELLNRIDGPVEVKVDVSVTELTHAQRMERLAAIAEQARSRRD